MTTNKETKEKQETTNPYEGKTIIIKENGKTIFKSNNKEMKEMTREEWEKFYQQADLL